MEKNNKEQGRRPFSFSTFDEKMFQDEKRLMEDFRKNCYGANMESIWEKIKHQYIPETEDMKIFASVTVDESGNISQDRLFASNKDSDLYDLKEPLLGVKVHAGLSLLTQRTPQVKWDSIAGYQKRVKELEAIRKNDWRDNQTRLQYVMLWFFDIMYGTAFWRRFHERDERTVYLPESVNKVTNEVSYKKQKIVEYDQITAKAYSPFEVWIDPATKPFMPRSMRKVMYEEVYDETTFLRLFKDKVSKEKLKSILPKSAVGRQGDNWFVCRFYENKDHDLYAVEVNDTFLFKDHLPFNHKDLSIEMITWMPRGGENPYGLGPIEMALPNKEILDELQNMTLSQLKFSIYKATFISGNLKQDGAEGDELKIRPDNVYKVSGGTGDIKFFDMPGPGAEAWNGIDRMRARVDDATGINRPLGGEITKSTAYEIDLAKDAALARLTVPIDRMVLMLERDTEKLFELQKQYYSLPEIIEISDPLEITQAYEELAKASLNNPLEEKGEAPDFSLFVDKDEDGTEHVYKGVFRTMQISEGTDQSGGSTPGLESQSITLHPDIWDWRGKIYVVADSILSVTPTLERQRTMEAYNIVIPQFSMPPEIIAKSAREIMKLYGQDIEKIFPEHWLQYLAQLDSGKITREQAAQMAMQALAQMQAQKAGTPSNSEQTMSFEQERAPQVATNVGATSQSMINSASQTMNPVGSLSNMGANQ